jgi:phytoene desaturase
LGKIIIIGSGFAGLSAATYLANKGHEVKVFEKNDKAGGRANTFAASGFSFDMGPSWYWMPEVFEKYFATYGKKVSDYYNLTRIDPSYKIVFNNAAWDVAANLEQLKQQFEKLEPGAADKLQKFLAEAQYKYETGINKLVHKPGLSYLEFADWELLKGVLKLDVFTSTRKHVHKLFTHEHIRMMLEFPVIFLGGTAASIPALYTLMNYADIVGGTWYPQGGMYKVVEAMYSLAKEKGVEFYFNDPVASITVKQGKAIGINTALATHTADAVISAADYEHTEQTLIPAEYRNYNTEYWDKRTMAPSSLLYYVGLKRKVKNLTHHTLFFDVPFDEHANEIYESKQWPTNPLFYVGATSVTDNTVAPVDNENLFFLIPVAAGLDNDNEGQRKKYFDNIFERFVQKIDSSITQNDVVYYKSYGITNFINDYNSYKGNAYGLANTLKQTAIWKPTCVNKKVNNLFYTGQLTIPGPGVPPSIISGQVVGRLVNEKIF